MIWFLRHGTKDIDQGSLLRKLFFMHAIMYHATPTVVGIFQKTLMMDEDTNAYPQCDECADRQPVMKRA